MPRTCSICGKPMQEGYCYEGGMKYYCSDKCLRHDFSEEEWQELYAEGGDSYWTTWYDEDDLPTRIVNSTPVVNPHLHSTTTGTWIPVSERLPIAELEAHKNWSDEYEDFFIVMIAGATIPCGLYFDGVRWYEKEDGYSYNVTHWMKMPSPPSENQKGVT